MMPRSAALSLDRWHRHCVPCTVVGETATRYRVLITVRCWIMGRADVLEPGETTLVLKNRVEFL